MLLGLRAAHGRRLLGFKAQTVDFLQGLLCGHPSLDEETSQQRPGSLGSIQVAEIDGLIIIQPTLQNIEQLPRHRHVGRLEALQRTGVELDCLAVQVLGIAGETIGGLGQVENAGDAGFGQPGQALGDSTLDANYILRGIPYRGGWPDQQPAWDGSIHIQQGVNKIGLIEIVHQVRQVTL